MVCVTTQFPGSGSLWHLPFRLRYRAKKRHCSSSLFCAHHLSERAAVTIVSHVCRYGHHMDVVTELVSHASAGSLLVRSPHNWLPLHSAARASHVDAMVEYVRRLETLMDRDKVQVCWVRAWKHRGTVPEHEHCPSVRRSSSDGCLLLSMHKIGLRLMSLGVISELPLPKRSSALDRPSSS